MLTGAELARWCYENPNQAARTIEGLRTSINAEQLMQFLLDKAGGVCCLKCARAILAKFNVTPKMP